MRYNLLPHGPEKRASCTNRKKKVKDLCHTRLKSPRTVDGDGNVVSRSRKEIISNVLLTHAQSAQLHNRIENRTGCANTLECGISQTVILKRHLQKYNGPPLARKSGELESLLDHELRILTYLKEQIAGMFSTSHNRPNGWHLYLVFDVLGPT